MSYIGYNKRPKFLSSDGEIMGKRGVLQFSSMEEKEGKLVLRNLPVDLYNVIPKQVPTENVNYVHLYGSNFNSTCTVEIEGLNIEETHFITRYWMILKVQAGSVASLGGITINNGVEAIFRNQFLVTEGIPWNIEENLSMMVNTEYRDNGIYKIDDSNGIVGSCELVLPEGNWDVHWTLKPTDLEFGNSFSIMSYQDISDNTQLMRIRNYFETKLYYCDAPLVNFGTSSFEEQIKLRRYNGVWQLFRNGNLVREAIDTTIGKEMKIKFTLGKHNVDSIQVFSL